MTAPGVPFESTRLAVAAKAEPVVGAGEGIAERTGESDEDPCDESAFRLACTGAALAARAGPFFLAISKELNEVEVQTNRC
jgi:hypothetical protein